MNGVSSTELAAVLTCLGILVIYHIFYFYIILCKTPDTTKLTNSYRNAFLWASKHHISHDAATSTLGLHILRNTILIGIFVGGNSFNIAFSYLNNFESMGSTATISGIRAIILSSFLFASFLSWAMVIRCASHLGYLLGASPHDDQDEEIDQSYIDRMVCCCLCMIALYYGNDDFMSI